MQHLTLADIKSTVLAKAYLSCALTVF